MKHKRGQTKKSNNNTRGGGKGRGDGDRPEKRIILPKLSEFPKPEKKGFREIEIVPTKKEILAPPPEDIPINRIDKPYESIEEYLKTHYKLLREDCLRPLREGIRLLRTQPEEKNLNLRIYERIDLVRISFTSMGIVHRISFITKHCERVHWTTSKRLLPGTLVVFSRDNFETMKFGTVVNRPIELLEKKKSFDLQIDVLFQHDDIEFEWSEGYIMVEATSSYFEAYRHVLTVLQELDPETLPFKEHIIDLNKKIDTPDYLQKRAQSVYKFENDKMEEWPTTEKISPDLHSSQYEALKRMLTCRLALIQGPPGTGKTYVGLKAVKILLENMIPGPIVIACQTNHALDQFLEGIQEFEKKIIRLGSRSKSDKIKSCTLFNVKKDCNSSSDTPSIRNPDINRHFKQKEKIEDEMIKLCEEIGNPFLKLKFIEEKKYLSDEQISSLKQDDWFTSSSSINDDDGERDYIKEWLEQSIVTATSKQNDIDFQVSQLILHDSGNRMDEDDEFDEEEIQDVEADYHGNDDNQFMKSVKFVNLRSEKCIRMDTFIRDETIDDYCSVEDLWDIPQEIRVAMHNRWRRKNLEEICNKLKKLCKDYFDLSAKIKTERIREDLYILKSAHVVGMTTTAAAKYHKLLMNLKPKIMIIEEAAETLEAHIVTALTPATEHLILIGDHQQLRPNISVHELAKSHNLNVSLFERLIKSLPYCQLTEQRRMRPEIRKLLTPIYNDTLTDHEDVKKYPDVPGFYDNLFFFDHQEEETHVEETMSKFNYFEAMMCVKFANYLVKGGMNVKHITILSMYSGQRKKIWQLLKEDSRKTPKLQQIRVSSVDGFQGEENDIILLSLVRSSEQRRSGIGFLGISNRVCVALSRARHGLYIFGNASQLRNSKSELWNKVLNILEGDGLCEQTIDIYCRKHSKKEEGPKGMVLISVADFTYIPPEGGCMRQCGEVMDCGHVCPNICHIYSHDEITCRESCIRKLPCGHKCNKPCIEACGNCEEMIIICPPCGHSKEIPCHATDKYICTERCSKQLKCGHQVRDQINNYVL
ncbi:P-loop containing nucleoside triphosphate hydrolase protein [Glomus cerebriforme]|uniref:P-loop containing nucleoside triphosphate hydrolase protein n=1 Tax=Glomus cerebriforme TaxID=658196 RepID=A0A397S8A3_9GLOM|nr:P-loop containing nucleoside triphosphate hydrolase protein [Glomus cerebriforme]